MKLLLRLVSIVLIAIGAGLLTYGLAVDAEHYRRPAGIRLLDSPSESAAWGAAILVAGALLLALFGRRASAPT